MSKETMDKIKAAKEQIDKSIKEIKQRKQLKGKQLKGSNMWTEKKGLILRDGTSVDLKRLAEYLNVVEDERAARIELAKQTREKVGLQAKKTIAQFKLLALESEKKKADALTKHKERVARAKTHDDEVKVLLDSIGADLDKIEGVLKG